VSLVVFDVNIDGLLPKLNPIPLAVVTGCIVDIPNAGVALGSTGFCAVKSKLGFGAFKKLASVPEDVVTGVEVVTGGTVGVTVGATGFEAIVLLPKLNPVNLGASFESDGKLGNTALFVSLSNGFFANSLITGDDVMEAMLSDTLLVTDVREAVEFTFNIRLFSKLNDTFFLMFALPVCVVSMIDGISCTEVSGLFKTDLSPGLSNLNSIGFPNENPVLEVGIAKKIKNKIS
jgi:hypothetical protein